jgi:hypothetical protein
MIELMIGIAAWVSLGAAAAIAVGRASTIGAQSAVTCRLARMPRR